MDGNLNDQIFIFRNNSILLHDSTTLELPDINFFKKCLEYQLAKDWFTESQYNYTAVLYDPNPPVPANYIFVPMRVLFAQSLPFAPIAARAHGILQWRQKTRYCPTCGHQLIDDKFETARTCTFCQNIIFPQISPAIIVIVHKDDKILLARHAQRNLDVYTCLAGYIEPGESAEECVKREVREETGIEIQNIRYVRSQSWPFPDQLMLGFKADWKSGDFHLQTEEIEDAKWFSPDNLPPTPPKGSVAWNLIHADFE